MKNPITQKELKSIKSNVENNAVWFVASFMEFDISGTKSEFIWEFSECSTAFDHFNSKVLDFSNRGRQKAVLGTCTDGVVRIGDVKITENTDWSMIEIK